MTSRRLRWLLLCLSTLANGAWAGVVPLLPASLPLRRDLPAEGTPDLSSMLILGLVFLLVFLFVQWHRRRGSRNGTMAASIARWLRPINSRPGRADADPGGPLRLVSSVRLNARVSLHVVSWDNRCRLLASSDSTVTVLAEAATPAASASVQFASVQSAPVPSTPAPSAPKQAGQ